uniref:VWFA domain-containing protein n=1 Tax=Theileria annulata TaxID=5874 RepID=A0A3B0NI54_THEAN
MTIEAALICIDNSEYSRNGDFVPTRLGAQIDAIGLIASAKLSEQFENSVGIVCLARKGSQLLTAPSNDLGTFLTDLQTVVPHSQSDFIRGIQTAQLALKHRLNKSQQQRIICFVASPIVEPVKHFVKLGKLLKKNNVILDIIDISNNSETEEKLKALHSAVNNNDTSHYLCCKPCSGTLLSDMIFNSAVLYGQSGGVGGGSQISQNLTDFGVDPEMDPQLYMALRLSLEQEEERLRKEATKMQNKTESTLTDIENELKGMEGLQVVPLDKCVEILSTSEGNPELLESLVYSFPDVDSEEPRIQVKFNFNKNFVGIGCKVEGTTTKVTVIPNK